MLGHRGGRRLILAGILITTAFALPRQESAAATLEGKLVHATTGITEQQGWSVSISGDTAVVGAPFADAAGSDSGAVDVFVRSAAPVGWTEQAQLLPILANDFDYFGWSVAVSGDTAVVGAVGWDCGLGENCGTAFVFERSGSIWSQLQQLTPNGVHEGGWFGAHVAIDEDYIIVGQPYCGTLVGCAHVYKHSEGMGWSPEATLLPSGGESGERFGWSVDIGRSPGLNRVYAVVGARADPPLVSGAAYVFETDTSGPWPQVARLLPDPVASNIHFGTSVALSGDIVLVGANHSDEIGDNGSVYVFARHAGGDWGGDWTREAKLLASDAAASDQFGYSVALDGDTAVIGALREDSTAADSGGAYVFRRGSGLWTEVEKLLGADGGATGEFGASVAIDGLSALIGAPRAGAADVGAAYVYALPAPEPITPLLQVWAMASIALFSQWNRWRRSRAYVGATAGGGNRHVDCGKSFPRRALPLVALGLASAVPDARALDVVPTLLEASTGFGAVHAISGDGRRVVYESNSDPVGGNTDGNNELFLWDQSLGVSQITDTTGSGTYWALDIDRSGHTIAMVARPDDGGPGIPKDDLYRWVDGAGWTQLTTASGLFDQVFIDGIGISADGGTVLFTSAGNYTGANAGNELQVFLWRAASGFEQITTATPCGSLGGNFAIDLSGDGGRILLNSRCRINGGNPDLNSDVYLWDASSGFTALTDEADEVGALGSLDADGSTAALVSYNDLVNGGFGNGEQLFRWRAVGGFEQLSAEPVAHRAPSIDASGSRIAYTAANGQGTAGNPEGSNEIFLWDAGAIFELTDSAQVDLYFGNEEPRLDDAGARLVMLAARAFDAPTDLRTGYFLLAVPEPGVALQFTIVVVTLVAFAPIHRRVR